VECVAKGVQGRADRSAAKAVGAKGRTRSAASRSRPEGLFFTIRWWRAPPVFAEMGPSETAMGPSGTEPNRRFLRNRATSGMRVAPKVAFLLGFSKRGTHNCHLRPNGPRISIHQATTARLHVSSRRRPASQALVRSHVLRPLWAPQADAVGFGLRLLLVL